MRSLLLRKSLFTGLMCASVLLLATFGLQAATRTWSGAGADSYWRTSANWDGDPNTNDVLIFAGSSRAVNTNDFAAMTTFAGMTFSPGAGAFTLLGNPVQLAGDITNNSSSLQTLALALTNATGLKVVGASDVTVSGVLSGAGTLTKEGAGILTLTGTDSPATGATLVKEGILLWNANDALPSGPVTVMPGATFVMGGQVTNGIVNSRGFVLGGSGTAGQGALMRTNGSSMVSSQGGVNGLTLTNSATINTAIRIDFSGTFNWGSNTLTKIGAGPLAIRSILNAPNAKLVVSSGMLYTEPNDVTVASMVVSNGANFSMYVYDPNTRTATAAITLCGTSSVASSCTSPYSGVARFAGTIDVAGGVATMTDGGISGNTGSIIVDSLITGTGTLILDGYNPNAAAAARYIRFNATNTFSGDVQLIDIGTFSLGHSLALQNATLDTRTNAVGLLCFLTLTQATFGGLKGTNSVALTNSLGEAVALAVGNNGQSTAFGGVLSGSGSLTKIGSGTLTLTNSASTYSGATLVSNGTLRVDATASLSSTNWVIAGGATLKFDSGVALAGKALTIDAGGAGSSGFLDVTGNLALGGQLTVANAGGDRKKIAQCTGTLTGEFAQTSMSAGYYLRKANGNELWLIHRVGTCVNVF